jgi:hypothetical protein
MPEKSDVALESRAKSLAPIRGRRTLVTVEQLAVLGHQVQQEQAHIYSENAVIAVVRMAQPRRHIARRTA